MPKQPKFKPGEKAPVSGQYPVVGPRGGKHAVPKAVLAEARHRRDLVLEIAMTHEAARAKYISGSVAHGTHNKPTSARDTAGKEAHNAWKELAIQADPEMNMGPLFERLEPIRKRPKPFKAELARATLPRRLRIFRWFRGTDL